MTTAAINVTCWTAAHVSTITRQHAAHKVTQNVEEAGNHEQLHCSHAAKPTKCSRMEAFDVHSINGEGHNRCHSKAPLLAVPFVVRPCL